MLKSLTDSSVVIFMQYINSFNENMYYYTIHLFESYGLYYLEDNESIEIQNSKLIKDITEIYWSLIKFKNFY